MTGRGLVLGVIAILLGSAVWTLARRGSKSEKSSQFKPWFPDR